jgi:hypothetical protein
MIFTDCVAFSPNEKCPTWPSLLNATSFPRRWFSSECENVDWFVRLCGIGYSWTLNFDFLNFYVSFGRKGPFDPLQFKRTKARLVKME